MRTTVPCFVTFSNAMVRPTFDALDLGPFITLLLTSLSFMTMKITIMPEFTPNSFMLEKHADKGDEPWKIFAWCVRDAISKHSGIEKLDEKLCLKDR